MQSLSHAPEEAGAGAAPATLERLRIRNFRNFADLRVELPPEGVMLVGPNGAGKTNFLEAIYYLELFRSFRGARDADLVRFGEDVFRVEADLRGSDGPTRVAAAWARAGRRKKVELDGREPERLADALGAVSAVAFQLDDAELVWGSPGRRRRFLDILLSLAEPGYLAALQRYRSALGQRNEALRRGARDVVEAWTEGLVGPGARVMSARAAWTAARSPDFGRYHAEIAGGAPGTLAHEPGLGAGREAPGTGDAPAWEAAFRAALAETEERDARRGVTTTGPQRDDLVIRAAVDDGAEERDLRTYGSGGQQRTAALALRLTEADTLRAARGREPVYLLDDVFAELDRERAGRLLRLLDEGRTGQVLLTAPKPADVPLRGGGLGRWRIRDGAVLADG
jgi:DNA replication and repair protein RecF